MKHLIVFRFSALGDVALTIPVLKSILTQHKEIHLTMVTRQAFAPLFTGAERLEVFPADFTGQHKGVRGLFRLFRQVKKEKRYSTVIDLHNVLRTKWLGFLFRMSGTKVYRIDKGRRDKRKLIRGKVDHPLPASVDRYFSVFTRAGFPSELIPGSWFIPESRYSVLEGGFRMGIAPSARHPLKEWPIGHMIQLMHLIREKGPVQFYLFGGREEKEKLEKIAAAVPDTHTETLDLPLEGQVSMMAQLHLMISMDSANAHLAALTGIPLLVIWGATHPFAGFAPVGAHESGFVQIPRTELDCRPCTIYGKGTCRRGDFACMQWITPEKVLEKIVAMKIL